MLHLERDQRIRDPIHNLISFSINRDEDVLLWTLLNSPPIQRLRRIKQLGFSEFVYPGATHSRFAHVLGAMEMARRMVAAFERNEVFGSGPEHEHMRKATLAAALIHDVGHGPYSHVFEELSENFGIDKAHESYTAELIESGHLRPALEKHGVYDEVRAFFEKEPGYSPYGAIISSQIDCDRLDFLVRDRYFTGIKSASIDLSWLFDSLRIDEVPLDLKRETSAYSLIVDTKGIGVTEEFVIAYMKMYQNVYFHKATRAIQHMCSETIRRAIATHGENDALKGHPIVRYFRNADDRSLDAYLGLDDSSVLSLIRLVADGEFGDESALARRYLDRDVFKCLELPLTAGGAIKKGLTKKFLEALKQDGVFHIYDYLTAKGYKQFDVADEKFLKNIIVRTADGELDSLHNVSDIVKAFRSDVVRVYFEDQQAKDRANEILRKI